MKIVNKNFPTNNSYFSKGNLYVYNFNYMGISVDESYDILISFSFISNKNYEENHKFTLDDFVELSPTERNANFINGIILSRDDDKYVFTPLFMAINKDSIAIYKVFNERGTVSFTFINPAEVGFVSKQIL